MEVIHNNRSAVFDNYKLNFFSFFSIYPQAFFAYVYEKCTYKYTF